MSVEKRINKISQEGLSSNKPLKANLPELERREMPDYKNVKPSFFYRNFFYRTALGRTLTGRNKTGQAIGVVLETLLSFTPARKWSEITGHIDTITEARQIGLPVDKLNLKPGTISKIKLCVVTGLILLIVFGLIGSEQVSTIIEILKLI